MAVFDRDEQKLVVRIVYDGPAFAGKTTNLRQLCRHFTTRRRGELFVPEEQDGRTLFFDWFHVDAGLVGGYTLRCQLVTVPGQSALATRRKHLLRTADVVVFVCESTVDGARQGREMLDAVRPLLRRAEGEDVPIVLQANKQDLTLSLEPARLAALLAIDPEAPMVAARASEDVGVREAVVLAIRAAANNVQRFLLQNGVSALSTVVEDGHALHDAMVMASELFASRAPSVAAAEALPAHGAAQNTEEPSPPSAPQARAEPVGEPEAVVSVPPSSRRAGSGRSPSSPPPSPPLPHGDAGSGLVWPAASGRELLRRLERADHPRLRTDLVARQGAQDGSGSSDLVLYEAWPFCLKTSSRRRFADVDEARGELLRLARGKSQLTDLALPNTVLVVQEDRDRGFWVWTVAPWVTTLRARAASCDRDDDERGLGTALELFAETVVRAAALILRQSVVLDLNPSNFGMDGGLPRYIDDHVASGARDPSMGHAILQRFDEYAHRPRALGAYQRALEALLSTRLTGSEARALDLDAALRDTIVRSPAAEQARLALRAALSQCRDVGTGT